MKCKKHQWKVAAGPYYSKNESGDSLMTVRRRCTKCGMEENKTVMLNSFSKEQA